MSTGRFYVEDPLEPGGQLNATPELLAHLKARRVRPGATVVLFDGGGGEYPARVEQVSKREAVLVVGEHDPREAESPLRVTLLQGVCKGERMDFAVQKAVELGVTGIVPVITRHTVVRLDAERGEKRRDHWQKVVVSACEQCGRNTLPVVEAPMSLERALEPSWPGRRFLLAAEGAESLARSLGEPEAVTLLVGPEGGLHPDEEDSARTAGFIPLALGPRILRTETAAVAALAALQAVAGDMG